MKKYIQFPVDDLNPSESDQMRRWAEESNREAMASMNMLANVVMLTVVASVILLVAWLCSK